MLNIIDDRGVQTFDWAGAANPPMDLAALLEVRLTPDWEVAHEVDPAGEVSIVVMPICESQGKPSFLLYEKHGQARVATIRDDIWESVQAFADPSQAVGAIVANTMSLVI